jgi:hypothetical protein
MSEEWKASVRSVGVNVFALLEEILDATLAFSSWLLLSDHFACEHVYNLRAARKLMCEELSGIISIEDKPITLDEGNKHTVSFGCWLLRARKTITRIAPEGDGVS